MKFDFGEVLRWMWKIGWNHKVLWLWQMLPGASVVFVFPSFFIYYPAFTKLMQNPELQIPIEPWMSISLNSMGALFVLSYALMWIFAQLTTICGAVEIEKGTANISFRELSRKSLPYVWRVFGLYFLYCGVWALMSVGFAPISWILAKNSPATLKTLMIFLSLPLSVVWLVSMVVLELAQAAIVADNMRVIAAILHAWKILKSNLLEMVIITIVLFFGVLTPLGLLLMPLPFLVGISSLFLTHAPDPNVIFFTVFFGIIPFVIILSTSLAGIFMTFFQSAWAVAYLRLSKNSNTSIILEEKPQEAGI